MILSLVLSRSSWNRIISERVPHTARPPSLQLAMELSTEVIETCAGNEHRSMLSILSTDFYLDVDGITRAHRTCLATWWAPYFWTLFTS